MECQWHCRVGLLPLPLQNCQSPCEPRSSHSHCKPWRDSANEERLNGENGLLLTPTMDHLFDRGFISFEDSGILIVSPVADVPSLNRMGITTADVVNVGVFTEGQKRFLDYHRDAVLLQVHQ